jgi:hypothetical protein
MIIFALPTLTTGKELSELFGQVWVDLRAGEAAVIEKASSEYRI